MLDATSLVLELHRASWNPSSNTIRSFMHMQITGIGGPAVSWCTVARMLRPPRRYCFPQRLFLQVQAFVSALSYSIFGFGRSEGWRWTGFSPIVHAQPYGEGYNRRIFDLCLSLCSYRARFDFPFSEGRPRFHWSTVSEGYANSGTVSRRKFSSTRYFAKLKSRGSSSPY